MAKPPKDKIPDLLVRNIKRDLVLAIEEALTVGAQRAYTAAHGMDDGHLPSVVGHSRHFHMNEAFHRALDVGGASPSPLCGNRIVVGRAGIFTLSRFNIKEGLWINGRRSATRKQISMANAAIEPLRQFELFADYVPPSEATAFFVACFSGSLRIHPESPVSIQIAVPDRHMQEWLFRERIDDFVRRYDQQPATMQNDLVTPKLKKNISKQRRGGTSR